MPAENDDKMTNSDENDVQNEQNPTHFDVNCTQKRSDIKFSHGVSHFLSLLL